MKKPHLSVEEAETIAINAIGFLASDEERIERFIAMSGIDPADLASQIGNRSFLAGILDHLLSDETLLFLFCDHAGLPPETPVAARIRLDPTGY